MGSFDEAVVLAVGDELVLGQTVDTNTAWLSNQLMTHGLGTGYHKTVADDTDAIRDALQEATSGRRLVLVTGGLGPTADDLTREALARAMAAPLELVPEALARIEAFFRSIGREMPDRNRCQAMCPRGATLLPNDHGTAPGVCAVMGASTVVSMPGVPHEMKPMFEASVLPLVAGSGGGVILTETVHTFGRGESDVAEQLGELMTRGRNPQVGITVSGGIVSVRVRSRAATQVEAIQARDMTVQAIRHALGDIVFGIGSETLPQVVIEGLTARRLTLATAESCTGGMIGAMLTEVPGSSAVYRGGWVVYANAMKEGALSVPAAMLAAHGAVSEDVARCLAQNACDQSGADVAVAVTGIAGPDGGTDEKPVGTVWVALARRGGPCDAMGYRFPGTRERVRDRTAKTALNWIRCVVNEAATEF